MFRIFFVLAIVFLSQDILSQEKREIYVIVHGAWGGGWSFKKVEEILKENKSIVYRPTLTGQGERVHLFSKKIGLETHIEDVSNMIKYEDISICFRDFASYSPPISRSRHTLDELHMLYGRNFQRKQDIF